MTERDAEEFKDLITHPGWKLLVDDLHSKLKIDIEALVSTTELDRVVRTQERIKAMRFVMNRPREILKGVQNV